MTETLEEKVDRLTKQADALFAEAVAMIGGPTQETVKRLWLAAEEMKLTAQVGLTKELADG